MHRDWKISHRMKKANVVPVHKKWQTTNENCRPILLLPICGKILQRLIYNKMFEFFTGNKLNSFNQSGFKPGDSCINQLLCITHDIYQSFIDGLDTRAVFLDISKAFDKVQDEGLLYKLKQNGISGNLLNIIKDFLSLRKQRVVLNGQYSTWVNIEAEVPQGSILGPLFFLIYINDLSSDLTSNPKLFADDTSVFYLLFLAQGVIFSRKLTNLIIHRYFLIKTQSDHLPLKNISEWQRHQIRLASKIRTKQDK